MDKEKIDAMLERVKESGYRSSLIMGRRKIASAGGA